MARAFPKPTKNSELSRLGGVDEQFFEALVALDLSTIGGFLTGDAVGCPRHSVQALRTDVLFAMDANAVHPFVDAPQGCSHVAQQVRFTVQVADRKFAFGRILHFVKSIRALLDGDAFAITD